MTSMHPVVRIGAGVGLTLALAAGAVVLVPAPAAAQDVPRYELDPLWPKLPFGERWLTGGLGGMCVGPDDHVFVLNRGNVVPADLDGARPAPPVIELDPDGVVVRGWGDPALIGDRLHDCHVEADGSVWIVAAGRVWCRSNAAAASCSTDRGDGEVRLVGRHTRGPAPQLRPRAVLPAGQPRRRPADRRRLRRGRGARGRQLPGGGPRPRRQVPAAVAAPPRRGRGGRHAAAALPARVARAGLRLRPAGGPHPGVRPRAASSATSTSRSIRSPPATRAAPAPAGRPSCSRLPRSGAAPNLRAQPEPRPGRRARPAQRRGPWRASAAAPAATAGSSRCPTASASTPPATSTWRNRKAGGSRSSWSSTDTPILPANRGAREPAGDRSGVPSGLPCGAARPLAQRATACARLRFII